MKQPFPIIVFIHVVLAFFCECRQLYAQPSFINYIGANGSDFGTCVIATSDGGYALTMNTSLNPPVNDSVGGVLVKTDCFGSVEWSRTFIIEQVNGAYEVIETADGGFLVELVTSPIFSSSRISLAKTDATGNLEWCKQYPLRGALMDNVVIHDDGSIFLLGNATAAQGNYESIGLMKLDAGGAVRWSKIFSFTYGVKPVDISMMGNDRCAIAASITVPGNSFTDVAVMITDTSGNQVNTAVAGTYYDDDAFDLDADEDGNIFVCGKAFFLNRAWDGMYLRFDEHLNLQQSSFYDGGSSDGEIFREGIRGTAGEMYLLGDAGTFDDRSLLVARTDITGSLVWSKSYPVFPGFTNYIFSASLRRDGAAGLAITGDVRTAVRLRDALLMSIDTAGNAPCNSQPAALIQNNPAITVIDTLLSDSSVTVTPLTVIPLIINNQVTMLSHCSDQLPCPNFAWQQDSICPACVQFHDLSLGNTTTAWEIANSGATITITEEDPLHCFDKAGDYQVTIFATNNSGTTTLTQIIQVERDCPLFIPNIFTPNGDQVNDEFLIRELPDHFHLRIFNRWGMELFETAEASSFWNGENENGNLVSEGVYYYLLSLPDENKELKGWVEVRY